MTQTATVNYREIFKQLFYNGLPFLLARVVVEVGSDYLTMVWLTELDPPGETHYLEAATLIDNYQAVTKSTCATAFYYLAVMMKTEVWPMNIGRLWRSAHLFAVILYASNFPLLFLSGDILKSMHQNPQASEITQRYFYSYLAGLPFIYFIVINQMILTGVEQPKPWHLLALSVLQRGMFIGLSYWLMFYSTLTPITKEMGLGAAASVAAAICYLVQYPWFKYGAHFKDYVAWNDMGFYENFAQMQKFKIMVKKGCFLMLSVGLESMSFLVPSLMLGRMSEYALAAAQPTWRYLHFLICGAFAFSQTFSGYIAQHSGDAQTCKRFLLTVCGLNALLPLLLLMIYAIDKQILIEPFGISEKTGHDIQPMSQTFLLWGLLAQVADSALRIPCAAYMRGKQDTETPFKINAVFMSLNLLLVTLISLLGDWQPQAIFITRAAAISMAGGVMSFFAIRKFRQSSDDSEMRLIQDFSSSF